MVFAGYSVSFSHCLFLCLCWTDLWKVEADRVVEAIAATHSDNPAEWEPFSTEESAERDGSEVNTSPVGLLV